MSLFQKIRGTSESIFQFALGGAQIKNSTGVLEARNAADTAYAKMRAATPVGADDVAIKSYVDANSSTSAIKLVRFALALATASSTFTVPASSRVLKSRLDVTTAYDAGATWSIGRSGGVSDFMTTAENDPSSVNAYEKDQDTTFGTAAVVTATLTGSPTVGVAIASIHYVETPSV